MKKAVIVFCAVVISLGSAQEASNRTQSPEKQSPQQIMTVDQVHPGMKGVAYTVFEGTKPESMGVEVLGVLKNLNGPRSDVILVRLHGSKPEYTGVVAGMSGSPVYIDGKLVGAIALKFGAFSKEPIAGVTPIAEMLEINEFDKSVSQNSPISTPHRVQRKRRLLPAHLTRFPVTRSFSRR